MNLLKIIKNKFNKKPVESTELDIREDIKTIADKTIIYQNYAYTDSFSRKYKVKRETGNLIIFEATFGDSIQPISNISLSIGKRNIKLTRDEEAYCMGKFCSAEIEQQQHDKNTLNQLLKDTVNQLN